MAAISMKSAGKVIVPAAREIVTLADLTDQTSVDLSNTDDPEALVGRLDQLTLIRVAFPAFNDGRAFTVARKLRMLGYTGQLLALGPVLADQYAMLRRVGFAVAPANVHHWLRDAVHWTTPSRGGEGAARELADLILHAQGKVYGLLGGTPR